MERSVIPPLIFDQQNKDLETPVAGKVYVSAACDSTRDSE
jgi:hypothetical protein